MARMTRPPRADAAIAAELSARFRAGTLYSYSYDEGTWSTWETLADWEHTERNGGYRTTCCAPELCPDGPTDWDRGELLAWLGLAAEPARKLTKAELLRRLRELDLPPEAVAILDAA